jgi:pimeloyl-ACP methyl ester carboxylesterase
LTAVIRTNRRTGSAVQLTHHRRIAVDGVDTFYREAGPADAPVVLLPHGYPCSSYEFRALIPRLADRWRLLAPDFPGCGYSATPEDFPYDFDGYAEFRLGFCRALHITRVAVWLHDFGSQIGLRLAITRPELIAAVIVQNGDIYEDTLGPGYAPLRQYWNDPSQRQYAALHAAVSEHGYRDEFINELRPELAETIPPDLWQLHWSLTTQHRRQIYTDVIAGLRENLAWFPRYQAWLREHRPPVLIVWGSRDRYMPAPAAHAYLRDLPNAELHLFDEGGHWLLETHLEPVTRLVRDFLTRHYSGG